MSVKTQTKDKLEEPVQDSSGESSPSSATESPVPDSPDADAEADEADADDKKKKRTVKGRVFQCTGFPGCNMSFTRSEHLARHKRKHTGERPFTCPYCSKNFSRLENLRQHKQTVHAYENYLATKKPEDKDEAAPPPGQQASQPPPHHYQGAGAPPPFHAQSHSRPPASGPDVNTISSNEEEPPSNASGNSGGGLRLPSHQFKPKRRPRPLSLQHSFVLNSDKLSSMSSLSSSGSSTLNTPVIPQDDVSTAGTTPTRGLDIAPIKDSTKSWLRGVLNDDDTSKKPTITSLLSPDNDKFQNGEVEKTKVTTQVKEEDN
ncbi:Up in starvation [Yamadazyma tenuis]|uniref:Up in starvation n=1 Tax=Candida tenuis TaxID=2315449 RepID=UPI0027A42958|nr:Up in starvation [Yamadazyma tenuis]